MPMGLVCIAQRTNNQPMPVENTRCSADGLGGSCRVEEFRWTHIFVSLAQAAARQCHALLAVRWHRTSFCAIIHGIIYTCGLAAARTHASTHICASIAMATFSRAAPPVHITRCACARESYVNRGGFAKCEFCACVRWPLFIAALRGPT